MDDDAARKVREAQVAAEVGRDTQALQERIAELDRQAAERAATERASRGDLG